MLTVKLNQVPLRTTWTENVPRQRAHSTFPLLGAEENEDTSVVYFELDPSNELGSHTDSAEEVLLIMAGSVEVTIGSEKAVVDAPGLAVVPQMVPHNLRNLGPTRAKVVGFFPARHIVATFENAWLPDNTNVVDTEQILLSFQP